MTQPNGIVWRSPEDLVEIGFARSRVVMMNEAHHHMTRCIRTREVGKRVISRAHSSGARYLAMEALTPRFAQVANDKRVLPNVQDEASFGYLSQPDMREFIQAALDLDWTLIPYEANTRQYLWGPSSTNGLNWRELQQAQNLTAALEASHEGSKIIVWCGGSHHSKQPARIRLWQKFFPMGYQFQRLSGIDPFCIDQNVTVEYPFRRRFRKRLLARYGEQLRNMGGTAGFLREEAPRGFPDRSGADASILSTDNEMT